MPSSLSQILPSVTLQLKKKTNTHSKGFQPIVSYLTAEVKLYFPKVLFEKEIDSIKLNFRYSLLLLSFLMWLLWNGKFFADSWKMHMSLSFIILKYQKKREKIGDGPDFPLFLWIENFIMLMMLMMCCFKVSTWIHANCLASMVETSH